jgi:hypothetical protein
MPKPPLDDAKIAKLKNLLDVVDTDTATKGEVAQVIGHVIDAVRLAHAKLTGRLDDATKSSDVEHKRLDGRIDTIHLTPGPKGDKGDKGDPGEGKDGRDGKDGKDAIDGRHGKDGKDGRDGTDGKTGENRYIGWGAHPLTIQALGITIDKNTRFINFTGSGIGSVSRSATGVVTVNITGGGGGTGTIVDQEVPTDSGDHTNFTIAHTPIAGTFHLYRGGAKQQSVGLTPDYTLTGTALALTTALNTTQGEQLVCDYSY